MHPPGPVMEALSPLPGHPFFDGYDVLLLVLGLGLLAIVLGRLLFERLNLNTTFVYLAIGILAGPLLLQMQPEDALVAMPLLERVSELAVTIGLIVLGMRIGRPLSWRAWRSTSRLILVLMPATIAAVAAAGMMLLGLDLGPAVLLGAILAPTDPILAGPLEEESTESDPEDRFGLSSEAGLNDGLAFPFIYLGLYLTLQPGDAGSWVWYWLVKDLLYAVALGLPLGWFAGRVVGRTYRRRLDDDAVSHRRHLFLPLALLLLAYGLTEALGAYGFLAAFTAGLGFRRAIEDEHERLANFANFTESVDELAKVAVLGMLGALMPWHDMLELGWRGLAFALLLIVIARPALAMMSTAAGGFRRQERIYWAWFGIRGIGSVYYLAYALGHGIEEVMGRQLFALTGITILASVVLHGLTVRPYMHHVKGDSVVEE
jgi:sodium/hydrogen antiporter